MKPAAAKTRKPAPKAKVPGARPVAVARIRYAVVGLGHLAQSAVLPAFAAAQDDCELVALVSDDPEKLAALAKKYHVARTYGYQGFDECLASGVDAVYIALPNSLHHDYVLKAAAAGVHVLCEKPMAATVAQAEAMDDAAKAAGIKLMIAYRLHFERANLRAIELANAQRLGALRFFSSSFSMMVRPGDIRTQPALGGGTVLDLGIYCINAARYLFRDEPIEVMAMSARGPDERFAEIDEMTAVIMRFPHERLATFTSSFGAADLASYELVGTRGSLRVDPAYEYTEALTHCLTIAGTSTETTFPVKNQFAAELSYFAACIRNDEEPEPNGDEGLADMRIIEAIYLSAREGRPVRIAPGAQVQRPKPDQEIDLPAATGKATLVKVTSPSEDA